MILPPKFFKKFKKTLKNQPKLKESCNTAIKKYLSCLPPRLLSYEGKKLVGVCILRGYAPDSSIFEIVYNPYKKELYWSSTRREIVDRRVPGATVMHILPSAKKLGHAWQKNRPVVN